jgi:hypothetical protein
MICFPTIIYLVVSLLSLLASFQYHNSNIISITGSFLFILLWSCLLNLVCKKSETAAWILLLLPLVFFVLVISVAFEVSVYNKVKNFSSNLGNLYR